MSSDILRPAPKAGEALIKIKCFGLNRMDLSQRSGNYPVPPQAGKILGVEFSGTIVEVHDVKGEENGFVIGDEVFDLTYGGTKGMHDLIGCLIACSNSLPQAHTPNSYQCPPKC